MAHGLDITFKSVVDEALELCFPTRCASCDDADALLCNACLKQAHSYEAEYACPLCGAPYGKLICTECWDEEFAFSKALALGTLEPPLSKACVLLKDANERRLGRYVGQLLGLRIQLAYPNWPDVVTWVPPSSSALRRRGFDHGILLAQGVSLVLGLQPQQTCRHKKSFDMRSLDRTQRKIAACQAFEFDAPVKAVKDKRVLLIDDVFTTGATLHAVSSTLLEAGAKEVRAAVVARAW